MIRSRAWWILAVLVLGCERTPAPQPDPAATSATAAPGAPSANASASAAPAAGIDEKRVSAITGGKIEATDGTVKASFPRDDVKVVVDAWAMPPFMGLTSWAAFTPGEKAGVEAMVMGDLVIFEDEIGAVMSAALDHGLQVTALHNHFIFDRPHVFFMHIGGEGALEDLAKGVRAAVDAWKEVRKKSPAVGDRSDGPEIPKTSSIDAAKVEAALGKKPASKDGMAKVVVGRAATRAACGCKVGKAMGVNTWAAFAGTNEDAVVDGDFAVSEDELQTVLKTLRKGGVQVVAIHHHMVGEEPRILFLHYWGRGTVEALGATLKTALAATKTEG